MGHSVSLLVGAVRLPYTVAPDSHQDRTLGIDLVPPTLLAERPAVRRPMPVKKRYLALPPPPEEFLFFPRLPAELRLMIWELVLPGERVVQIQEFTESSRRHKPSTACRCIGSKARVPTLLHVCHESRHLALKSYTITLKNRLLKPTYLNPKIDILLFASVDDFFKFAQPVALHHVLQVPAFSYAGPYPVRDNAGSYGTPPRRYTDSEKIEDKLRHLAIGRSNRMPCHLATGETPWEEFADPQILNLLGEFGNLDVLLVDGVYFEDMGVNPAPPLLAEYIIQAQLKRRWTVSKDEARGFPELAIVGATKMKQIRFRAREARLFSGARLAEYLP